MAGEPRDRPRVLLTGARGLLGGELQRDLAAIGTVTAVGRDGLDLADVGAIRRFVRQLRPAVIVNAAAYTAVDGAEQEPSVAYAVNAVAPGVLAEEAARLGSPIVHFSTDYVFDGGRGSPYRESDPPNPLSVYGRSKLEGERAVAGAGGAHLVLRTSWVYGPRGRTFLSRMLRWPELPSEIHAVRDQFSVPTWVRGLAAATATIVAGVTSNGADAAGPSIDAWGTYHLASMGGGASPYEFAEALLALDSARVAERRPRIVPIAAADVSAKAVRPRDSRLDSSRIATVLGVRIPDWREQLAHALRGQLEPRSRGPA